MKRNRRKPEQILKKIKEIESYIAHVACATKPGPMIHFGAKIGGIPAAMKGIWFRTFPKTNNSFIKCIQFLPFVNSSINMEL